jgi:hypothetical protein
MVDSETLASISFFTSSFVRSPLVRSEWEVSQLRRIPKTEAITVFIKPPIKLH